MNFTSTCGPATAYFIYFQVRMFNSKTDVMPGMWGTGMMMAYERRMATGLQLLKPMIHNNSLYYSMFTFNFFPQ